MDILEALRAAPGEHDITARAAHEIERLRLENEILRSAMEGADIAMAGAPIWHAQHRVVTEVLIGLRKALADAERAEATYAETHETCTA